mmetsp:Transcript_6736/g.16823  ORF Transcript_6736/g.16823 Transcript_6736/m.16823 type:complete len:232 (+) Transcript_6736:2376-3071(+)
MTSDVRFRLDVAFSIVLASGVSARTLSILLPDAVFEEETVGEFDPDFGEDKLFALMVARLGMRMDSFLGALGFEGDSRTVVWLFSASTLTETTSLLDEVEVSANGCFCLATGCDSDANGLDSTRMLEFCCCCCCCCCCCFCLSSMYGTNCETASRLHPYSSALDWWLVEMLPSRNITAAPKWMGWFSLPASFVALRSASETASVSNRFAAVRGVVLVLVLLPFRDCGSKVR